MAGHAQLKFVMTECSKTQIRLTGLICNNTRNNKEEEEVVVVVVVIIVVCMKIEWTGKSVNL